MKITAYDLALDDSGQDILVRDREFNYSGIEKLVQPSKVAQAIRQIIGAFEISHGGMLASSASLVSIFKRLLLLPLCSAFILTHNHPAGEPYPSNEDIDFTLKVKDAAKLFGADLKFLDHIVIGRKSDYYSLQEHGYI